MAPSSAILGWAALCLLPIPWALLPILCRFGDPYQTTTGFTGLLQENWAYFCWYTPVGWGSLWYTISLWSAKLLGAGCLAPDTAGGLAASTAAPALGACVLFVLAARFWAFPTPFATFTLGFWCFVMEFLALALRLPAAWWAESGNGCRFAKVCTIWFAWIMLLFALAVLTSVQMRLSEEYVAQALAGLFAVGKIVAELLSMAALGLFFSAAQDAALEGAQTVTTSYSSHLGVGASRSEPSSPASPRESLKVVLAGTADVEPAAPQTNADQLGEEADQFEKRTFPVLLLTWLSYSLIIYQNFMFPVRGSWGAMVGISAVGVIKEAWRVRVISMQSTARADARDKETTEGSNLVDGGENRSRTEGETRGWSQQIPVATQLERLIIGQICETLAPVHFAAIFAFDVFGWNKEQMYQMELVSPDMACLTLKILGANFLFQGGISFLCVRWLLREGAMCTGDQQVLRAFLFGLHGEWLRPLVLLMGSITTIAGACMIMKHDGMDMTFQWEWLQQ